MNGLKLAKVVTELAKESFESGEMYQKVTSVTAELLKFWFDESYCDTREKNFHTGQKQAILNVIFLHEVVKAKTLYDIYEKVAPDLLPFIDMKELKEEKFSYYKYCIKMATGTGKTWVMHALFLWQILNARNITDEESNHIFTSNFLVIAPGLIVYDRLLDAFLGRKNEKTGERDFLLNDFHLNEELFIPPYYRDEVYSFLQNNVKQKDEISNITSGGIIAITNWHLFIDKSKTAEVVDDEYLEEKDYYKRIVNEMLPAKPGTSSGNSLDVLDNNYLRGESLEYLAELDSLMIINDEAHHINNNSTKDNDVIWQQGINYIMKNKKKARIQLDFSATPYVSKGTGAREKKVYFPHIVTNFDLNNAIKQGLVKLLNIDKREEITNIENLDYKAERDDAGNVVSLSEGQRLMINAGLAHLNILDEAFRSLAKGEENYKQPKMLIMCEDTNVSPLVCDYLMDKGLNEEDVLRIDSNRQGEVDKNEWLELKDRLFNVDRYSKPRVIVSVLMLREGFDVNNICVIVPLRSTSSAILLEQTIGRGLRLMFRGRDFEEEKKENRNLVFTGNAPKSFIDMLFIVEHPAFISFYDELLRNGLATQMKDNIISSDVKGSLESVELKSDYYDYDLYFPFVLQEEQEEIVPLEIDINKLPVFDLYSLETLKHLLAKDGENFISQNVHSKTSLTKYNVNANLFSAETYNEYLQKILDTILYYNKKINRRFLPALQINNALIVAYIDEYIRHRLFNKEFNPFEDNNWKMLLVNNGVVTTFIREKFSKKINDILINQITEQAEIKKIWFSSVKSITIRKEYSVEVNKSIYPCLKYPSNKGGLERDFIGYCDKQSEVKSFIKIDETRHRFAYIPYINEDGLLAQYHPDFIVKSTGDNGQTMITIVETKAHSMLSSENVKRKQTAVLEWIKRINSAMQTTDETQEAVWQYALISNNTFYSTARNNITFNNLISLNKVTTNQVKETLF
ncbi:MAG: DEAD/DEAH box helicase family protein [Bacteroidales bacterium]|nr:DEAD/DEAH box helicase family protein [Bacteroidales bacterium]